MSHTPTLTRFGAWLEPRPMGLGEPNGGLSRRSKPEPNEDEPAPPYRSRSPWATDGKHRKKKLHRWSQQRRLLRWWRARSMPVEPLAATGTGRRKARRRHGPTRWRPACSCCGSPQPGRRVRPCGCRRRRRSPPAARASRRLENRAAWADIGRRQPVHPVVNRSTPPRGAPILRSPGNCDAALPPVASAAR